MDEYSATCLSHPLLVAQKLGRRPADERKKRIWAERWFGSPRAVDALNRLETLYAWRGKERMHKLLMIGQTNKGK